MHWKRRSSACTLLVCGVDYGSALLLFVVDGRVCVTDLTCPFMRSYRVVTGSHGRAAGYAPGSAVGASRYCPRTVSCHERHVCAVVHVLAGVRSELASLSSQVPSVAVAPVDVGGIGDVAILERNRRAEAARVREQRYAETTRRLNEQYLQKLQKLADKVRCAGVRVVCMDRP